VLLDSARADEELRADFSARVSLGHETSDLGFLRRQVGEGVHGPLASVPTCRLEFYARSIGERLHSEVREHVVGGLKLFAGVDPARLTSKPFSVEQVRARKIDRDPRARQPLDCLAVLLVGSRSIQQKRV
jgi:hypothetical protein